jgi:hypothetical protein
MVPKAGLERVYRVGGTLLAYIAVTKRIISGISRFKC